MGTTVQDQVCLPWEASSPIKEGGLVHLKTKLEVTAEENVVFSFLQSSGNLGAAAEPPQSHLRQSLPDLDKINLQHLRRFVKPEFLPRPNVYGERGGGCPHQPPSTSTGLDHGCNTSGRDGLDHAVLSMLVSPTRIISGDILDDCLNAYGPLLDYLEGPPIVWTTAAPLLPPNTAEQAQYWSQKYWPTVYKGSNPFGPHPSIVSRVEQHLRPKAAHFMSLALQAGAQARARGLGDAVGAVIVDGLASSSNPLTIVAGDARWHCPVMGSAGCEGSGNVMGHAVMRAIGMVAQRRLHSAEGSPHPIAISPAGGEPTKSIVPEKLISILDTPLELPLTPIENTFYQQCSISSDGYLCVGLDIYTTHEPCVMCSMAVLHSRFRGIVFGRRMMQTGGLTAEVTHQSPRTHSPDSELHGLGYGMFWRNELNWKLSAWQWEDQEQSSIPEVNPRTHA